MNMKNFPKRLDSKTSYLRITVPENLDLALEGLIRKVLKEQPKTDDIYSFAANYFETLLKIRDKAGAKFTSDQLCPFHNDEDAHEMIKLAGTFSKPDTEELRKKNEELLLSKTGNAATNKNPEKKVQDKKSVRKPKSKKASKDEKAVSQNKQATYKIIKKLPMTLKNIPEEEKKLVELADPRSDGIILDKNTEKEESDDEEFLASDPIKELVEKELMETKLNGKKEEIKENNATDLKVSMPPDELTSNENIQEQRKSIDNINVRSAINDANGPIAEENTANKEKVVEKDKENESRDEETEKTEVLIEKEIKIQNNEVTEQASEKSISHVKEKNKEKIAGTEETKKEETEDMEGESKESAKNKEKSNEESIQSTVEIDPKTTTDVKNVAKEENKRIEKTNRSTENTEEAKIIIDKSSDFKTTEPEEQTLKQEIQSEEEINRQSTVRSSEIIKDVVTEKDVNRAIRSEILDKDNTTDINHSIKEQEERNAKTSEEIPPNEIKPEEKEPKEFLNDQQTARVNDQTNEEREIKFPTEMSEKVENSESTAENQTVETSAVNIKPPFTDPDAKRDVEKVKVNNNQELKAQEKKMTEGKQTADINSPKKDKATEKILKNAEELNNEDSATQTKQQSEVIIKVKEEQTDETENKQYVFKNYEKPLQTGETTEDKDENTIQSAEENNAKALESKTTVKENKTDEIKLIPEPNENILDEKSENTSWTDSKNNFLKEKPNESSSTDKKFCQSEDKKSDISSLKLLPDPTNPNELMKSEKREKLLNEHRAKITEDTLFGEKTHDLAQSDENSQTPDEVVDTLQTQKKEILGTGEEQQSVNQNTAVFQLTNKKSVSQEEENVEKLENSLDLSSANKPDEEKLNKTLKSDNDETQSKEHKTELVKELRKEESDNQKPYFKAQDDIARISEDNLKKEELNTDVEIHQIPKEDEVNDEKSNEKSQSKDKSKTNNENEEVNSKAEEELCTVVDIQQIPKEDAIYRNKLEEKDKPEAESTQNGEDKIKDEERTIEEESPRVIIVEETQTNKVEENQGMSQASGEIQIKTIQSHYYNTLQVPETVTKEYRVHNVSSLPMGALLNVANSLQHSYESKPELLNKEERIEKIVDVNMNSSPIVEKVSNVSSPAEPTEIAALTEDIEYDDFRSVDHLKNSKASTFPSANASNQNELESDTQKSDSDDLLDLMTPTSGYSLNLSELSWQTINESFLDSEKRNSSLEKEEIRYAIPKTGTTTWDSGEQKTTETRQEIEEVIHKTVVPSRTEAVPIPPRDLESNTQISENVEEEKEEKTEGESAESSSESSNEQISVNDDTPFISVEVKTVIETQILDDDDDENSQIRKKEQKSEEKIQPDMEIKVETTIDFRDEMGMKHSESESKKNKMETTDGIRRNGLKSSLETQDKNRHGKPEESSSTEQTAGGEGSSGESDSTISSAATEIKRADFAKRNFSSTRSLLSTQSLDLEKKTPLVKTRSLSTFRHGVTDFEVWSAIEKELEEAATKIQSKFRGYKTRKKLQRENAVQITTEESSLSVTPVEAEIENGCQQSTGEFHDSIVLSEHPR